VLPYTIGHYFVTSKQPKPSASHAEFKKAEEDIKAFTSRLLSIKGKRTPTSLHRELGMLLWEKCGMARNEAGLKEALKRIPELAKNSGKNVNVTGEGGELNQSLEYAGGSLTLWNSPSCFAGCPASPRILRRPFPRGVPDARREAQRDDQNFAYVAAWEYQGAGKAPVLHQEPLVYEEVT